MCKREIISILIKRVEKRTATKLVAGISGWLSISDSKLEFWYPFLVGIPIFGWVTPRFCWEDTLKDEAQFSSSLGRSRKIGWRFGVLALDMESEP